jgi:hypothetical protein
MVPFMRQHNLSRAIGCLYFLLRTKSSFESVTRDGIKFGVCASGQNAKWREQSRRAREVSECAEHTPTDRPTERAARSALSLMPGLIRVSGRLHFRTS